MRRLAESALTGIADIPNQVAHSATQGEGEPLQVVADRLIISRRVPPGASSPSPSRRA